MNRIPTATVPDATRKALACAGVMLLGLLGPAIADGLLLALGALPGALLAALGQLSDAAGLLLEIARWALGL